MFFIQNLENLSQTQCSKTENLYHKWNNFASIESTESPKGLASAVIYNEQNDNYKKFFLCYRHQYLSMWEING